MHHTADVHPEIQNAADAEQGKPASEEGNHSVVPVFMLEIHEHVLVYRLTWGLGHTQPPCNTPLHYTIHVPLLLQVS